MLSSLAILIETKSSRVAESSASEPELYLKELRRKLVGTLDGGKGIAQLARNLRAFADGTYEDTTGVFSSVPKDAPLVPVLLVADPLMRAPLHSWFFANEFRALMGMPDMAGVSRMVFGGRPVLDLVVLTIEDLENLESVDFSIFDCFLEYARACADRITAFHDFLADSHYGSSVRSNPYLSKSLEDSFDRLAQRLAAGS
jgi:hypothetical protein